MIQTVFVTAPGAYPAAANLVLSFSPTRVVFVLDDQGAGKSITLSMDGVNDHIHLHYDHNILSYTTFQQARQWWVKGTSTVMATAESPSAGG